MRTLLISLVLLTQPTVVFADGADGVWKTQTGKDGGFLEVTISTCGNKKCGTITKAYGSDGSLDKDYTHLGKAIISNMESDGPDGYTGGTIWNPENGKTYKSKMTVNGNTLNVKGCIGPVCSGQEWTRIR